MVSACVLIRTRRGEFDEVVEKIKRFKEVERIFPVLGRYDVVADVEAPDSVTLGNVILRMGRMAGVVFTETLVEIQHGEG
ncbi:MAG: Lrp/AsnC ligand binding domain-containing protein [Candidatus Geothermarchaeales archaeon]